MMYFRARYYDSTTGEFVSRDPLEYVDGMSLYRGYFVVKGVDPFGLAKNTQYVVDFKFVAKSFINGVVGGIGRYPSQSPAGLFGQLLLNAFAAGTAANFQENPTHDLKAGGDYRIFTELQPRLICDCRRGLVNVSVPFEDTDAGFEPGGFRGTITLAGPILAQDGKRCARVRWRGYGKPDPRIEFTFQTVLQRSSVNIWHESEIKVCCDGSHKVLNFRTSDFPSHKLWGQQWLGGIQYSRRNPVPLEE